MKARSLYSGKMINPTSRLRQILECTTDCVFTLDRNWRFTFLNSKALKELSPALPILNVRILDAYPQLAETPFWSAYQRAMDERQSQHLEAFMPGFDAWYEVHAAPTEEGIAVFFSNIDGRKRQETALKEGKDQLRRILDHIPQMVWTADGIGSFDNFNRTWYEFTGIAPGSMSAEPRLDVFHPDDRKSVVRNWMAALANGLPYEDQYRLKYHGDEWRWVISRAWPETDETGAVVRWYGTCTDIHSGTEAKKALAESELLYRSVLEASADCIKIMSVDGRLELMNEPGRQLLQIDDFEQLRGRDWRSLWPEDMRQQVLASVESAAAGNNVRFSGLCPTTRGIPKWWDVAVTPMIDKTGAVTRLLSISRDITDQRERANQIEWASEHDALTGLPNRRAFNTRLQAAVLRAMNSNRSVGLLIMDLDHFKHVNDTLGHAAGDELLISFTGKLTEAVRSDDYVARLGGDEFAIIIEDLKSKEVLNTTGASILSRLAEPIKAGAHFVRASASLGGALFPRDASCAAELMACADTALFALKAAGRGGTKLFESDLRQELQRAASELSLGRAAVSEQRIVPYYQPKLELSSGRTIGYEALLRWVTPTSDIQLPDTLAESFKNYELAAQIGEAMQRQVLLDIASGRLLDLSCNHISINAAPAEFLRDDYAERLLKLIGTSGAPTSAIQVEVTEHVFFERHSLFVTRALRKLHDSGVRIALDDFGTGYSSLAHLRDFPVDVLKIDLTFTQKMCGDPGIRSIVSAVIDLACDLKIDVVAEGIETEEQRTELLCLGCAFGQGYYFGRPAPFAAVAAAGGLGREAA